MKLYHQYITQEQYNWLRRISQQQAGVTPSEIVRRLINACMIEMGENESSETK